MYCALENIFPHTSHIEDASLPPTVPKLGSSLRNYGVQNEATFVLEIRCISVTNSDMSRSDEDSPDCCGLTEDCSARQVAQ